MSEPFRELLIGCGHSRVKKMPSLDGNPEWRNLITLDQNSSCDPDIIADLDVAGVWDISLQHRYRNTALRELPWFTMADCFANDVFDEVHAYEVLEHLGSQGDAHAFFDTFSEIWRILRPGGCLYATVPSRYSEWLWGDPSHRRAILPCSLVFLDQSEYIKQLDGPRKTAMSDFRSIYTADFQTRRSIDNRETFQFVLEAVKPSRRVA